MTSTPSTKTSIFLMLGSVVLFAVNVLMIRALNLYFPAADGWVASLFRGIVGLMVVGAMFHGRGLQISHLFTKPLLIIRGLIGGFGILALYITVVHLGAGRSVIINLSYPMFGSLFAAIWLKEYLPLRSWLWMIAGFTGLVIFLGIDLHAGVNLYDLLGLAGAIAAGIVVVLIRQLRHTEHTATIYASQCFASAMFAAWPAVGPTLSLPGNAVLLMALGAAIVAIAQLAMTHAYRTLSVARGSSIQMLLPILTAIGGYFFFQESFTAIELLGAVTTLFATWRIVMTRDRPQPLPVTTCS
ncbi:DMT family transporter [Haloferula chungangensis]|uniref:DMT family transporter n=1 Tax=Haloferula chungangensis TaxID=1048331 RepID=A0ABW2L8T3_9BACT